MKGSFQVEIPFDRSTAGTHLYKFKSYNRDAAIQNIYVAKDAIETPEPPKVVKVTVEYEY